MRLLLTSGGLSNDTIVNELLDLAELPSEKLKVAFIPTALNILPGDKSWAINQMVRIQKLGVKQLDIVDISAVPKSVWMPRLIESNIIFVNGGNTTFLMQSFNKSGLSHELPKLLKSRVYVGASAGSYILTPDIRFNSDENNQSLDGLKLVKFGIQAHFRNPKFPFATSLESIKERIKGTPYTVYVLGDDMAMKVNDEKLEIVGEGEYLIFKP